VSAAPASRRFDATTPEASLRPPWDGLTSGWYGLRSSKSIKVVLMVSRPSRPQPSNSSLGQRSEGPASAVRERRNVDGSRPAWVESSSPQKGKVPTVTGARVAKAIGPHTFARRVHHRGPRTRGAAARCTGSRLSCRPPHNRALRPGEDLPRSPRHLMRGLTYIVRAAR
jgi:hypothetical protein